MKNKTKKVYLVGILIVTWLIAITILYLISTKIGG